MKLDIYIILPLLYKGCLKTCKYIIKLQCSVMNAYVRITVSRSLTSDTRNFFGTRKKLIHSIIRRFVIYTTKSGKSLTTQISSLF